MRTHIDGGRSAGTISKSRTRKQQVALARAAENKRYALEGLESRFMLSTINWTNRTVSDNFGVLGASTATARSVVDRAIDDWERVITNFNYSGGGNTFSVSVTIADLGPGARGSTGVSYNAQQRPTSATITLDDDGGGSGWYFDSNVGTATLQDDSEFTTLINAFQADSSSTDFDFYRTIAHELGHAMGLASSSTLLQGLDTNIGDDPNDSGTADLFTINLDGVPGADYCYTNAGGFHLYEGPSVGGNPIHPNELMNSGRTAVTGRRQLISDTIATLLRDAYGYTVTLPSTINTFYANLNTSTNVLTVQGDSGSAVDTITISVSGSNTIVSVNGTTETIASAEYTTLTINSNAGADIITINALPSGKTVTVNAGDGGDSITLGGGDFDTNTDSSLTVNGNNGTDTITINDTTDGLSADHYVFENTSFHKDIGGTLTFATTENLSINGSANADVYDIAFVASTVSLTVDGNAGNDTFNVASSTLDIDNSIIGSLSIIGGLDTDTIVFDDSGDAGNEEYILDSGALQKPGTPLGTLTFSGHEAINLTANNNDDTLTLHRFFAAVSLTVNAGDGNDLIRNSDGTSFDDLDANWTGTLVLNGGAGTDSFVLLDTSDFGADTYSLTTTTFSKTGVPTQSFSAIESLSLNANGDNNTINITSTSSVIPTTVNGGGGGDEFNLGNPGGNAEAMNGALTINGDAGTDSWEYHDSTNAFNNTYTLTSTTVTRTANGVVTFGTIENTTLDIGPGGAGGGQVVNVTTYESITTSLLSLVINGNSGIDTYNLASGDLENDLAFVAITVNGGAGSDALYLNDLTDPEGTDSYTLTSTTFDKSTAGLNLITFGTMEAVTLDANPFSNTVNINSIANGVAVTARGNSGADTFNIGNGDMDSNFLGGTLSIDGGADSDTVVFNDTTDGPAADSYTINSTTLDKTNFAAPISYTSFETERLEASPNADTIVMNSSFPNWRINGNAGVDTITVLGNQFGSTVTVDSGSNGDIVQVNTDGGGTASITFPLTQILSTLEIGNGGTAILSAGANKVLVASTLTIDAVGGKLDLNNNDAIINYAGASPAATLRSRLISGRNAGAWNGVGISSTIAAGIAADAGNIHKTALGYAEATAIGSPPTFDGIAIDNTTILISYTWSGDADLSQKINTLDFNMLAGSFGQAGKVWSQADFNYDGTVDSLDFNQIVTNYALPAAAPIAGSPVISVPDTTTGPIGTGPSDDSVTPWRVGDMFSDDPIGDSVVA